MTPKHLLIIIPTLLTLSTPLYAAKEETIHFKNTRGSELTLTIASDNTLSGTFTTAVASKTCQQAIGQKRPITGFTAKNAITFSANYPDCGSVVSFTGNLEDNRTSINTTTIVAHESKSSIEGPGNRMIAHDLFKKV